MLEIMAFFSYWILPTVLWLPDTFRSLSFSISSLYPNTNSWKERGKDWCVLEWKFVVARFVKHVSTAVKENLFDNY